MGMPKYDRLLYILNLLRSRKSLNAARLAEECHVTERSIYRDLISLSEANVPIYYDRGYKLASDNFLPPLNFTLEEYRYLKLAIESSPLNSAGRGGDLLSHIRAKIEAGLSDVTRKQKVTATDSAFVDIENTTAEENSKKYFADIEKAASERLCLDLEYESIKSGRTSRRIEPYFIIFRGRAFYFVAYCRLRREARTFRLDRVVTLDITDQTFRRRQNLNATDYFEHSWRVYSGKPVEVVVDFEGESARVVASGRYNRHEQKKQMNDGRLRYTVTVNGTDEILRWILGFGEEAMIIRPALLKREVASIASRMHRRYRSR